MKITKYIYGMKESTLFQSSVPEFAQLQLSARCEPSATTHNT